MTRVMRQISNKQQTNSAILLQDQCKAEIQIKQKNISKLIFVESDDEGQEDSEAIGKLSQTFQFARPRRSDHDANLHNKRPFSKQFKGDAKMLKPSLMSNNTDNCQDYDQVINYQTTQPAEYPQTRRKSKRLKTTQQSLKLEQLIDKRDKFRESQSMVNRKSPLQEKTRAKEGKDKGKYQKKEKNVQEEEIIIPRLQMANICFEMSDQQPQNGSIDKKNIVQPQKKQQGRSTVEQKDDKPTTVQSEHTQTAQQPMMSEIVNVDITDFVPNHKVAQRSQYLQQTLKQLTFDQQQKILTLVQTPQLAGTKQIFSLQVFNSLTQKSYDFWLDMSQKMRLLMKANKYVTLNRTTYEFYTFDSKSKQCLQTCTMTSNIDRSLFNMYKIDCRTNKKRLLATYNQTINIKSNKLIVMYFPKVSKTNESAVIYEDEGKRDLQMIYRQNLMQDVDYAMSTSLQTETKLKMMDYYDFRPSQKSIEFKSSNGNMQVLIGKKQSKRYKIVTAPGLSPLQIFGLAIVQIQT